MNFIKLLCTVLVLVTTNTSSAKLLQIIHSNDLHSFFEGSRSGNGGYARIKTLVDQLKSDATAKGIKSIFLDAGDFGEGSSFYFSNKGVDAFKGLDLLGVDATVVGNHDFILGGKELSRQIKEANLQAKIISANMEGKILMGLRKKIPDYIDYNLDGLKLRVFGLTTPEVHYQYPLLPRGFIAPAIKKGIKMAEKSQRDGVDLLIALTHIGLEEDMKLVSKSRSIDLIVGGHSHTRLDQPKMIQNQNGEIIPIVQTGAHGTAIGSIIIDVLGKGEYKLIDYRLYDVTKEISENEKVKDFVAEAYINREKYFNRSWDEIIGFSEIKLTGLYEGRVRDSRSCWSKHIARLTRETAQTDLSIQLDIFQGEEIPAGAIRFGDLIDNFPHFRKWGDKGWNIAKARVSGLILNQILKYLGSGNQPLDATLDGVETLNKTTGEVEPFINGVHNTDSAIVKGGKISNWKFYSIAMPSEIPYAVGKMSALIRDLLLKNATEVPNSHFWPLFENYISKNSPLKCLED
jgi:2',3'-cyclic-nucleotide 2'-phosphodiesterase (5'-nucleotidase family)